MNPVYSVEDPHPETKSYDVEKSRQENEKNEQQMSEEERDVANEYYVLGYN